jgi:hypothetical protein
MQPAPQTGDAPMGLVLIASVVAAVIDWRYKRRGGKKPTLKDRRFFLAACAVCFICLILFAVLGSSAEGLGYLFGCCLVILFAVWELARWRVRRRNPLPTITQSM